MAVRNREFVFSLCFVCLFSLFPFLHHVLFLSFGLRLLFWLFFLFSLSSPSPFLWYFVLIAYLVLVLPLLSFVLSFFISFRHVPDAHHSIPRLRYVLNSHYNLQGGNERAAGDAVANFAFRRFLARS